MGSEGCRLHDVSFTPLHCFTNPSLTPPSRPGQINCFSSAEEFVDFWNGTVVFPQIDIKYGFTDPVDLQYFESQVPVMEQKLQAFKQVCLKGPSAEFLPYVGTTATVRDLVAIAEYFDGEGCDVNYYGFSYGTLIGNYLVNSKSSTPQPIPNSHSFQCSPIVLAGSSWTACWIPSLTPISPPTWPGPILWSLRTRLSRALLRDAPFLALTDVLSPPILPLSKESSTGPGT